MSAERQYKIACDYGNCGDWVILKTRTVAEARKQAHKNRWAHRDGRDYCPRHRP